MGRLGLSEERREQKQRVPAYLRVDVLGGVLVCAIAVIIWLGSAGLAVGELRRFEPGLLPKVFSAVLMAGGLVLLMRGLTQSRASAERLVLAFRGPLAVGLAVGVFAIFIKGYVLGPLQVPQLGLLVVGPITVLIAGMGSVEAEPRELLVLGIGLSALAVLVFADLLNMQVPVFPAVIAETLPLDWGPDWPMRGAILVYLALALGLWWLFGLTPTSKARSAGEARP